MDLCVQSVLRGTWESDADPTILTFGFEPPAKPALTVAVPLSITMGWLRRIELPPTSASPTPESVPFSAPLMVVVLVVLAEMTRLADRACSC